MRTHILGAAAAIAIAAPGCRSSQGAPAPDLTGGQPTVCPVEAEMPAVGMIPKARIYRTSAPSDSLVPVTANASRTVLTSYPAPTDLTAPPARLTDGWLLDSRGISPQSAFTTYTYSEYRSLPSAPSPEQLLRSIDPSVTVTEIVELPMTVSGVTPKEADELIRAGLPGCRTIFTR